VFAVQTFQRVRIHCSALEHLTVAIRFANGRLLHEYQVIRTGAGSRERIMRALLSPRISESTFADPSVASLTVLAAVALIILPAILVLCGGGKKPKPKTPAVSQRPGSQVYQPPPGYYVPRQGPYGPVAGAYMYGPPAQLHGSQMGPYPPMLVPGMPDAHASQVPPGAPSPHAWMGQVPPPPHSFLSSTGAPPAARPVQHGSLGPQCMPQTPRCYATVSTYYDRK
jgi:hypothetical protein